MTYVCQLFFGADFITTAGYLEKPAAQFGSRRNVYIDLMTTFGTLSFGTLPVPKSSYVGPFARYTTVLKLCSSTTYHTCRLLRHAENLVWKATNVWRDAPYSALVVTHCMSRSPLASVATTSGSCVLDPSSTATATRLIQYVWTQTLYKVNTTRAVSSFP
ncbi:hypothetical protein BC629DRAFT_1178165 [Irpex lacteus]|nr:hypothetical protein BC629DRAFT_1178165 [Irpex lacteus]